MCYYACLQVFYHPTCKCIPLACYCICLILILPINWTITLVCSERIGQPALSPFPPQNMDFAGAVCIWLSKGFCRTIVFFISWSFLCILFPSRLTLHRGFTICSLSQGAECSKNPQLTNNKTRVGQELCKLNNQSWELFSSTKLLMLWQPSQPQSLGNYSYTKRFLQLWLFFSWQISIPWVTDIQHHQTCSRVTCFYNRPSVQTSLLTRCLDCSGVMPGKSFILCMLCVPVRDEISKKIITAYKGVCSFMNKHSF